MKDIDIINESKLISLIKKRDKASFSYLYDEYCGALYGTILRFTTYRQLANEILEKVFLNIWTNIANYDSSNSSFFT